MRSAKQRNAGSPGRNQTSVLALVAALNAAGLARAEPVLPSGGQVVAGLASIGTPSAATLTIDQTSARAIIDWQGFSIGAGGRVHFANGSGATLNRVISGDPSSIAGQLSASGSLFLINSAGILVGPGGRVQTGGYFVASTRPADATRFMADGTLLLDGTGGSVRNAGEILAGGDAVLIGAVVDNGGSLRAGGAARLIAAGRVVLRDAAGDSRIHIEHVSGAAGDVTTSGRIEAASAELRAVGGNVYALAADTGGVVRATGSETVGGDIRLIGSGIVSVSGTLDASGGRGGSIDMTASAVGVGPAARIVATGSTGDGGTIRIGGARQGGIFEPGPVSLAAAETVNIVDGAVIDAGSRDGRGGEVILWSTAVTRFDGTIRADGARGGGFVETSSKGALGIDSGRVHVGNGQWLLDPRDVAISTGGFTLSSPYAPSYTINPPTGATVYNVNALSLVGALNAGSNVTVTTTSPGSTMNGDITVSSAVNWSGAGSLALVADRDIVVNELLRTQGSGGLTLTAGRDIGFGVAAAAAITGNGTGAITLGAGRNIAVTKLVSVVNGPLSITAATNFTQSANISSTGTGAVLLRATAGTLTGGATTTASGGGALTLVAGGNVTSSAINMSGGGSLSVTSGAALTIGGAVAVAGAGNTVFDAAATLAINSNVQVTGTGNLSFFGRGAGIVMGGNANRTIRTTGGALIFSAPGVAGDVDLRKTSGSLFNNSQIYAAGGPITVSAGRDVRIAGSGTAGGWIRFGRLTDTGTIGITAGRNAIVAAGATATDNFADLLGAGPIGIVAAGLQITSGTGSNAGITARGATLTTTVTTGTIAGRFDSTATTTMTGAYAVSVSPVLTLASGNNYVLTSGSSLTATVPLAITTSGSGDVSLLGPVAGTSFTAIAGDVFTIGSTVAMSAAGTPLVLVAGTRFDNLAGGSVLSAPAGRWLTYSQSPLVDSGGSPGASNYNLYGRTFTANPPGGISQTGNRRIFSLVPTLTLTAGTGSKTYGAGDPGIGFTTAGLIAGDLLADALATGPTVGSPGFPVAAPVGSYATSVAATASDQGYLLAFVPGALTVMAATLTVSAHALSKIYGDADPALSYAVSGLVAGDTEALVVSGALARAAGEAVAGSPYAIGAGTLAVGSNYVLSFVGADFTITPAALAIAALPGTKVYGSADPTLGFSATGFRFADSAATVLTGGLARTAGETVAGGPYAIGQGTLAANSNYAVAFTSADLSITPASLAVIADPAGKTYGTVDPALTFAASGFQFADTAATVLSGGLVRSPGESVTGSPYAIIAGTLAADSNYTLAFTGADFTISPAALSIGSLGGTKVYGDADPLLAFSATGFRLGDDPSILTGSLSRAAGETVAGGSYATNVGSLSGGGNYVLAFTSADFTITPAPLTLVADAALKTYGAADPAFAFTATGFRLGDTDASLTGSLGRTPGEAVGLYDIVQGGLANSNYAILFTGAKLTIDPALLLVAADAQSREYGLADPALTFAASGFQFGEDAAVLTGGLARAPGENVGLYAIGQGSLGGANYAIAYTAANFAITPAPLRITPADASKLYKAADPASFAFTTGAFRLGDTAATALTGALARASGELLGDFAILPGALASTGNYALSFDPATFSILARGLSVTALDQSKTYGDADPLFTFTATGFAPGDDPSVFSGALGRVAGEGVGLYAITQGTLAAYGYSFAFQPGTLEIDPALLVVTAADGAREYGLPDPGALGFTASGFRFADDATVLTGALARDAGEAVGGYAITQGSLGAANYVFDYRPGTYRITPATLSVTAADSGKVYGAADPAPLPFAATGFRLGDGASILSGGLARASGETVGDYAIAQGSLAAGANYVIAYTPGTFRISPAALSIAALAGGKVYGDADPALAFITTGLVGGDTVASALGGSLARAAGEDVGSYGIALGTLSAGNYVIDFTPAAFAISPAALLVAADAQSKIYGDADPALTFVAGGFKFADSAATVLWGGLVRAPGETVAGGPYAIGQGSLISNPNYVLSFTGNALTIAPAILSIVSEGGGKAYGDPDPELTFTAGGFRLGDTVDILTGALSRTPGESVARSPYAITLGTLSAGSNYDLSFTSTPFDISTQELYVVADSLSKVYGDADPKLTFTASGFQFADTVDTVLTGSLERAEGEAVDIYAIREGSLEANTNYNIVFSWGRFVIRPAPLLITSLVASRVYGEPDPILPFDATGLRFDDTPATALIGALARAPGENVGDYAVNIGTLTGANYALSFTPALFSIAPAALMVRADALSKVYGEPDPALTFAASGFRLTDTAATVLSGALSRAPGETVPGGPYAIGQGSLTASANYVLAFTGASLAITPRSLSASLTGTVGRVYDATVVAPLSPANLLLAGLLPGDAVTASATGRFDTPDTGTGKLVTATGFAFSGAAAANYSLSGTASASIGTITPAPLRVTAIDIERLFGRANPPFPLSAEGLLGGDTLAAIGVSGSSPATIESQPGPYPIDVVGAPRNYVLTSISGTLTVQPLVQSAALQEQVTVPVLGGLVQQGVGSGVTAPEDTLLAQVQGRPELLVATSRFTVSIDPAFARPAVSGGLRP